MKKVFFIGLFLSSAELFGGVENFGRSRSRTSSECMNSINIYSNRTRTFSEIPQEIQSKNLKKEQEILENRRNLIKGSADFRRKRFDKLQDEHPLNKKEPLSLEYGDFKFHGEILNDNAFGRGKITHKRGILTIEGWFYENFLDLSRRIEITGANKNKTCIFEPLVWENKQKYQRLISVDDIVRAERTVSYEESLYLRFSGGNEGIAFNPEFIYKGALDNDEFTGKGIIIKNTGEILSGKFYRGIYKGNEEIEN